MLEKLDRLERVDILRMNEISKRWEGLNEVTRDYLMTQSALRVPTISETLRGRLQDRRMEDLDVITHSATLPKELADFVMFRNGVVLL